MRATSLRAFTALLVGSLLAFASRSGRAEETKVRIEYRAPPGCPDGAAFLAQVKQRTRRARFADPDELALTLRVSVDVEPHRSVARVEFTDTDSRRVVREVGGETCDEVVKGIALVTALAVDARAAAASASAPAHPAPVQAASPAATPPPPLAEPPRAWPVRSAGLGWEAGIGFHGTSGAAPELLFGLGAFVGFHPRPVSWSVRAGMIHAESPTVRHDGAEANFRLTVGRAELCPVRFVLSAALAFVPCAAFDAGVLVGSGERTEIVPEPASATEFWMGASLLSRLELCLEDFLLVEAQPELGFPLVREEFVFELDPDRTVHEIPPVRYGFALAVGFRFH